MPTNSSLYLPKIPHSPLAYEIASYPSKDGLFLKNAGQGIYYHVISSTSQAGLLLVTKSNKQNLQSCLTHHRFLDSTLGWPHPLYIRTTISNKYVSAIYPSLPDSSKPRNDVQGQSLYRRSDPHSFLQSTAWSHACFLNLRHYTITVSATTLPFWCNSQLI